jgi:hypothetical protein
VSEQKKQGPTEMRAEIIRLHREGKMPSLQDVLDAVFEVRKTFVPKILAARKRRR